MPQGYVLIWSLVCLDGVLPNQERKVCAFGGIVRIACFCANRNMAAIAACITDGMAHLAGELAAVQLVHQDIILLSRRSDVTGFTAWLLSA